MGKFVDLTGKRIGFWKITRRLDEKRGTSFLWVCECKCGNIRRKTSSELNNSKSCGCYRDELSRKRFIPHKILSSTETKKCGRCELWMPLNLFGTDKYSWDKLNGTCRKCESKRRDSRRHKDREYENNKRKTDLNYKITKVLRSRISHAIKRNQKTDTTKGLLGCSIEYFKEYLESMFDENMSWENYGSYWHIDHKRPCASFDLSDQKQQRQCFHYTNLQPMYWQDNIRKGDKYEYSYSS